MKLKVMVEDALENGCVWMGGDRYHYKGGWIEWWRTGVMDIERAMSHLREVFLGEVFEENGEEVRLIVKEWLKERV